MTADAKARHLLRTADQAALHTALSGVLTAARVHDEGGLDINPDWLAQFIADNLADCADRQEADQ